MKDKCDSVLAGGKGKGKKAKEGLDIKLGVRRIKLWLQIN